jgi:hypothetical protein
LGIRNLELVMKSKNYLIFILITTILFYCKGEQKPEILAGIDDCKHCKMVITQTNQACGFFHDNNFETFCSPTCLLSGYEYLKKEKKINDSHIYFTDYETKQFVRSDSTYFLFTKSIPTVMNSGVLCFTSTKRAESLKSQPEEFVTDWRKYQVLAGTPDKIVEIKLGDNLMEPAVVIFNKNEIIQLEIEKIGQIKNQLFFIRGYEEVGKFKFPEGESFLTIRMIADKPGAGFPILMEGLDQPLGMIKVLGAHTRDEEVL